MTLSTVVLLLTLSGVIVGLQHVRSIKVTSLSCNIFKYPTHDIKRFLVEDLLQDLVTSRLPYWQERGMGVNIPRKKPLIYAYANCTGHAQYDGCIGCLKLAKKTLLQYCPHKVGGAVCLDICYMRYEDYFF
ncbi:hypothetical protein LINPERPRIM_LOCUS3102 [Linum perenne]